MELYAYRWENGDTSIVYAQDAWEAFELLNEFGNLEGIIPETGILPDPLPGKHLRRLKKLDSFLIDFSLTDLGHLILNEPDPFGEDFIRKLLKWAYPILAKVREEISEKESELTPRVLRKKLREAVGRERKRLTSQ
jgi:hypothetical protein